jgi:hypothetical protein
LVGLVLQGTSAFLYLQTRQFLRTASTATGTVDDLIQEASEDSEGNWSTYYYPLFQFRTSDGKDIQVRSKAGSNPSYFRIGQSVQVLYNPNDAQSAQINSFSQLWLGTVICFVLGDVFMLIGLFQLFSH